MDRQGTHFSALTSDRAQPVTPPPVGAQAYAVVLFDLRRVPRAGTRITPEVEERVLNRCLLAALEALSARGGEVTLAGSEHSPVIEARFEGESSPVLAVETSVEALAAVRRAQRSAENEFQLAGAIAVGTAEAVEEGVVLTTGAPETAVQRLSELAGPGQVVMSAAVRRACGNLIETSPIRKASTATVHDVEAFVLRRLAGEARPG